MAYTLQNGKKSKELLNTNKKDVAHLNKVEGVFLKRSDKKKKKKERVEMRKLGK